MDSITFAAKLVVAVLLVLGLAGSLLPFLPGTPLILAAALLHALVTDFSPIGAGRLLILAGLTALALVLDYVAGAVGVKRFGGSAWSVWGAVIGGVVGLFFGPLGLLLGPVVGAVAGELVKGGAVEHSLRAGFGAAVGMVCGLLGRFTIALAMSSLFLWWLWRG